MRTDMRRLSVMVTMLGVVAGPAWVRAQPSVPTAATASGGASVEGTPGGAGSKTH